jgi:hypothetical protein
MIFKPLLPKAGPIGGDGLAAPPFTCNFKYPVTSLAIAFFIYLIVHFALQDKGSRF